MQPKGGKDTDKKLGLLWGVVKLQAQAETHELIHYMYIHYNNFVVLR